MRQTSSAHEERTDALEYDVFISYATDDFDRAVEIAEQLRTTGLSVFLDVPGAVVRSPLRAAIDALKQRLSRRIVGSDAAPPPGRLSDSQIHEKLSQHLGRSRCVLALWSRSHRGSFWAGQELEIFEAAHGGRPIFYLKLDHVPFEPSTPQWRLLGEARELTRERIAQGVSQRDSLATAPTARRPLGVLLQSRGWLERAQRLRSGTSLPELIGMQNAVSRGGALAEGRRQLLHSAKASWARFYLVSALLLLAACAVGALLPPERLLARHCVFATFMVWVACPFIAFQVSIATLLPAAWVAVAAGLMTQFMIVAWTDSVRGGPAVGAALGALLGGVFCHAFMQAKSTGMTALWRQTQPALTRTAVGTAIAVVLATGVSVLIAPQHGTLRDSLLLIVVALLLTLPSLALWQELSHSRRAREALQRGVLSGLGLLGIALAIAWGFSATDARLNQQRLPGAIVGGTLTAICVGAAYVAPGALLALRVHPFVRTASSVISVSVTLFALYAAFLWLRPGDDFIHDLRAGCITYSLAFVAALGVAAWWDRFTSSLERSVTP